MVTCAKCNSPSRVVDSRYIMHPAQLTKLRIRQCKKCRWKWKTVEIELKARK